MAAIDLTSGSASAYGSGELQLQGKVQMTGTLTPVTDNLNNASPLNLSTSLVQTTSTLKITTSDVAYIDAEDNSGNNRFTVSRAVASQLVTVDFASLPTALTTPVGAIRTGTDGVNLANVMTFLENGQIGMGTDTPTAKLQVKGDGTNPVARFESSAGANFLLINNSGQAVFGSAGANEPYLVNYNGTLTESAGGHSLRIRQRANTGSTGNTLIQYWADGLFSGTTSGTAISHEFLSSGFAGATGSGNYRNLSIAYTINNSGAQTGTATGIFLNATETALNGQTHNLMDLQVGGVSRFKVNNVGIITGTTYVSANEYQFVVGTRIRSVSNGIITLGNNDLTNFSLLTFGNTTSSFPAIKRNGTAIDFRLADDSAFCSINANSIGIGTAVTITQNTGTTAWNTTLGNVTGNVGTLAVFSLNMGADISTSSTSNYFNITKTISPNTGSANFNNLICNYTINASGVQTGTATGILLNATETNLNGMTHNLMDLQVGGSSKFNVNNVGAISIGNAVALAVAIPSTHKVTIVIGGTTYYLLATNI